MTDPLSYRQGGRGTGRTTRLVKATPKGGIYIVNNSNMVGVIKNYLRQIGREGEVDVMSFEQARTGLRGRRCPVAMDHYIDDHQMDAAIEVNMLASRMPFILSNDYEGDVITTYKEPYA